MPTRSSKWFIVALLAGVSLYHAGIAPGPFQAGQASPTLDLPVGGQGASAPGQRQGVGEEPLPPSKRIAGHPPEAFPTLTAPESSGSRNLSIESRVDKSTITIGELVKYSITVTRDESVQVEMPGLAANLGGFEIRDYQVHEPKKINGQIVEQFDYVISTFDVGEFEIPPLTIRYKTAGDTTTRELKTETIKLIVQSLKPNPEGDIKDIKPPLEIPRDLRRWIILAGIVLLLLTAAAVAAYIIRKKLRGEALIPKKVTPPRPAQEVALEELEALTKSGLLEAGAVKEFYIRLSEIIRRYIEGRWRIIAMEMTTGEVVEDLRQAEVPDEVVGMVEEFLESCDLVKFAKYLPTDEENRKAVEQAYDLVRRTKPVEVVALAEAGTASEALAEKANGASDFTSDAGARPL